MKVVCLLTTYQRPKLLEQSLRHIEREARAIAAPLVIFDDQSSDFKTIKILEDAKARGLDVHTRQWSRTKDDNSHFATGFHAVHSFKYILKNYGDFDMMLKLDDDLILSEGAFADMIKAYEQASADGYHVIACSGMQGIYEATAYEPKDRDYCLVVTPCAVSCLYPMHDLKTFVENSSVGEIAAAGWDHAYHEFRNKWHGNAVFANTYPYSVAYHTGHSGTHLINQDLNRPGKFKGSIEGVITSES